MSTDRCGFVYDGAGISEVGATCCWRPVHEGADRCVWHTAEPVAREAYERNRPVGGERLDGATLHGASLSGVDWLADCGLVGADVADAVLADADLSGADLRHATFGDVNARGCRFDGATFHDATLQSVDLRGATFRDAELYRVTFSDVRVDAETRFDDIAVYERRLGAGRDQEQNFAAATWVYRELQRLAERNALSAVTADYEVREQDLRRRYAWARGDYLHALFLEGSRWVMRYGTSPWRILAASAALILVSALLYPVTGGIREVAGERTITYRIADPETAPWRYGIRVFLRSLYFSVVTFSSLGYGDIQPVGGYARLIASVETLLGTLLMALLIFVLTRRFR